MLIYWTAIIFCWWQGQASFITWFEFYSSPFLLYVRQDIYFANGRATALVLFGLNVVFSLSFVCWARYIFCQWQGRHITFTTQIGIGIDLVGILRKHWYVPKRNCDNFSSETCILCSIKTPGFRNCRPSRCEPHKREFYVNVAVIVAFQSQPNKNAALLPMGVKRWKRTQFMFHLCWFWSTRWLVSDQQAVWLCFYSVPIWTVLKTISNWQS